MRRLNILFATLVVACTHSVSTTGPLPAAGPFDVIITNGRIVDGTGNAWFYGDVAIAGGKIARITPRGILANASAKRRIDARGLVVAPGAIDIQAQSYVQMLTGDSRMVSMITQGITTMILGEGDTPAPATTGCIASPNESPPTPRIGDDARLHRRARLRCLASRDGAAPPSVNVGSFVGAGTVRAYAKGMTAGPPPRPRWTRCDASCATRCSTARSASAAR